MVSDSCSAAVSDIILHYKARFYNETLHLIVHEQSRTDYSGCFAFFMAVTRLVLSRISHGAGQKAGCGFLGGNGKRQK